MIIGTSDYSKIKTPAKPWSGKQGGAIAECTTFGWVIMSPGHETYVSTMFSAGYSSADFERLWSLYVLVNRLKIAANQ